MRIKPFGDRALLIEFEQKIHPEINAQVMAWGEAIKMAPFKGIQAIIPAYCSLTICYHPKKTNYKKLQQAILQLEPKQKNNPTTKHQIPICYEKPFALDLQSLSQELQLHPQDIIQKHQEQHYRVYLLGFLPGFAYLGQLPKSLHCSRKATPRVNIPAGSLGIAGQQTGIYPSNSPGGWQIIGRTPIPLLKPHKENPFLLQAGDQVQFNPISTEEFHFLKEQHSAT